MMEVEDEIKEEKEEIKDEPEGDKASSYAGEGPNEEAMATPVPTDGSDIGAGEGIETPSDSQAPIMPASRSHNTWPP